ncbi:MAG: CDP-diacylglycerol--glycerol-3-phosphate 3-phosphatidyltransferase [Rhizobiales bacterium]|nr:CDP-diacylglycerol--glycerol-3-phosphate 3-phosphatidyltransferase [Hyphomicrobiales bacterium]
MIWTVPNILTFARLAAVPAVALALLAVGGPSGRLLAFWLFVAASLTDFIDGYLARRLDQSSELGRMLDPIADKLLVMIALVALVADGTITGLDIAAALIIIAREVLVSGIREFLGERGKGHLVRVSMAAKVKTTLQMLALASLMLVGALGGGTAEAMVAQVGHALLWIAALLTVYTGIEYLRAALANLDK